MKRYDGRLRLAVCGPPATTPTNHQQVHISSLALLKMLKHGRAGVPMEVCLIEELNETVSSHICWSLTIIPINQPNQTR